MDDILEGIVRVMAKALEKKTGEDMNLITYVTYRTGHDHRYAIDSTKLPKKLGWEPSLQFDDGIENTVRL